MEKSNETNEVFAAFVLFQGEVDDVKRDAQAHKYKYAKLEQVVQTRKLLSKHGLGLTQLPGKCQDGVLELENIVLHKSGQWFSRVMEMPIGQVPPGMSLAQYIGSLLSYERRYGWLSSCGLAQEDDDAALPESKVKNKKSDDSYHKEVFLPPPQPDRLPSLQKQLYILVKKYKIEEEVVRKWQQNHKVNSLRNLNDEDAQFLIDGIKSKFEGENNEAL